MPREENEIVVDDTNINGDVASPVRSRAFGVLESPSAALPGSPSLAISSGGCLYDGSQSFGTDNIAYSYRSKELWKYNKNDSGGVSASLGFIPEEEVGQSQDEDGNGVLEALRGGRKETEDENDTHQQEQVNTTPRPGETKPVDDHVLDRAYARVYERIKQGNAKNCHKLNTG